MENNFIRINLAESKLPIFKENKAKGFMTYGEDNLYPMGIIELFNKSPKHSAIVTQKASYIAGDKTEIIGQSTEDIAKANDYLSNINAYEDFESLKQKIAQDLELFDGFALEIIWNKAKTSIAEIYHLPFQNVRIGLEGDYVYCEDWSNRRAEHYRYPCWNPTTRENKQVYYFKMYRAGQEMYPLPSYVGALKYIEIDTEIANFHLNSIKSGFSAQTLVQLFKGIPNAQEARNTIKRFKDNFTGTDNAGSVIIQFNDPNETPSRVDNLAPSDFDKLFMQLNDTVQQEIFSGHRVTSPMLFGIRVEGQLGGRSELIESYESFQTSYVEPRQSQLDSAFSSIFKYIAPVKLKTKNRPPIGLDYVNLFEKGIISVDEARLELGMSSKQEMSKQNPFGWDDDRDVKVFEQFGEEKDKFEEVKFEFASTLGIAILQWLNANTGMQLADLINGIKADPQVITEEVAKLISDGLLNDDLTTTEQGSKELKDSGVTTEIVVRYEYTKAPGISGSEVIPTSRDFCRRVVGFNRLYTREDIEQMTSILGYDVWRRRGGWMTVKGSSPAVHVPYCRHYWASRLVRRKL
jgi:hypothetical protein